MDYLDLLMMFYPPDYRYTRTQMYGMQFSALVFLIIFHQLTDGEYWIPR